MAHIGDTPGPPEKLLSVIFSVSVCMLMFCCSSVLATEPTQADALQTEASNLSRAGRFDRVVELLDKAIIASPKNAKLYADRGTACLELDRFQQSIADFSQALKLQPDSPTNDLVYLLRSKAFMKIHEPAKALTDLQMVMKGNSSVLDLAYYGAGQALESTGDNTGAIEKYSKCLEIQPNFLQALVGRGHARMAGVQNKEAIADFDKCLAAEPACIPALLLRGDALMNIAETQKAISDYTAILQQAPKDFDTLMKRGFARYLARDWNGAVEDFDGALELQTNEVAHTYRGFSKLGNASFEEAKKDFRKSIVLAGPGSDPILNYHGMFLAETALGHKTVAEKWNHKAQTSSSYQGRKNALENISKQIFSH